MTPFIENMKHFCGSLIFSLLGILTSFVIGFLQGSWLLALNFVWLSLLLAVLEISLSFDNAVLNASVLRKMTPIWQKRFLTWGILIAVFGMRLFFPIFIVQILSGLSFFETFMMALKDPREYARHLSESHLELSAFGGVFLLMVAFDFFYDHKKTHHWFYTIEDFFSKIARFPNLKYYLGVLILLILAGEMPSESRQRFLLPGFFGLAVFLAIHTLNSYLGKLGQNIAKASLGMFIYLEVLDASFSFDGVLGAFALTQNILIIMIGLSIGAIFIRSLTIYLVQRKTLESLEFLEHGAFYAILILAVILLINPFVHTPEFVTGLAGASFLGASVWASLSKKRKLK